MMAPDWLANSIFCVYRIKFRVQFQLIRNTWSHVSVVVLSLCADSQLKNFEGTNPAAANSRVLFEEKSLAVEFSVQSLIDEESSQSYPPQSNMVLRKRIRKIKQGMKL